MKSKEGQTKDASAPLASFSPEQPRPERGGEVARCLSLRDLRGSVPVEGPQDFAAIRERIGHDLAREAAMTGTDSVAEAVTEAASAAYRNQELSSNDL